MTKPLLFITGFLGAGKTTLLRALLEEFNRLDQTADVILNDFENAEIDASTLPASSASVFPLAASCACCDSLEDLVKLCLAAQKSEGDSLLIELNGTADPLPLLETFTLMEEKMPFLPRWQIAVIDARHWGKREEFNPLEVRQVETATHWHLSHGESLNDAEISAIAQSVEKVNRYAMRIEAHRLAKDLHATTTLPLPKTEVLYRNKTECGGTDPIQDHEHEISHRFTGWQVPLPGRYRSEQIVHFLESLPEEVVRAKALVKLKNAPGCRWLFGRTGQDPVGEPLRVDTLSNAAPTSLVCIGPGLEPVLLLEKVRSSFGLQL